MDLKLAESYDGGELVKTAKDFQVIYGLGNMPYLALFGGNVRANTPNERIPSEQNFDFWGNELLMPDDPGMQFNSETERALINTPLTSAGREIIQQAVFQDLRHMKDFARVGVSVAIIATDVVRIGIRVEEPDNLQQRDFIFIWDATRNELTDDLPSRLIRSGDISSEGFDYTFDFSF
jgi:hypothetical protein